MKTITVTSLQELTDALLAEGQDALFRGQIRHYEDEGKPSFKTSFDREGCIPHQMLKWSYFANEVLNHWFRDVPLDKNISQAVLQHYGWRSFYIDVTSRPAVAAWFASNAFKSGISIHMCEDHEERPALLRKKDARYEPQDGTGHLYIIDKAKAQELVGAIDLSPFKLPELRPRFTAQAAWLLGPIVRKPFPSECIRAHIVADCSILRELAICEALTDTDTLFPGVHEDPVLYSLLSMPWLVVEGQQPGMRGFRRAVEFPEYQHAFDKRLGGDIALFSGERLTPDENDKDGKIIVVPVITVVGTADPVATAFPHVVDLLKDLKGVAFEVDYLARHAGQEGTDLYGKGIHVSRHDDGNFELGELMVRHPGYDLMGAGKNRGWFYRVGEDGTWNRISDKRECDCGNDFIHLRHLSALTIIEAWLTEPWPLDKD